MLDFLLHLSTPVLWGFFLAENLAITVLVLVAGRIIQRYAAPGVASYQYTRREWLWCMVTNVLNTVITYIGFWCWRKGLITISAGISWRILVDFCLLFLAMDLLMYAFHFIVHKTFLYKAIHQLHHMATDPKPIDLFILHPVETLSFGALWVLLLLLYPFNIYAIVIYLVVNVVFGMMGHLGIEPLPPATLQRHPWLRYLGTSGFHHDHHRDVNANFGFYTSLWDRFFGTYKQ